MTNIPFIESEESEEEKFDDMGFEGEIPEPPPAKRKKSNVNHGAWNCIFCGITQQDYEGGVITHTTKYCRIYLECIGKVCHQLDITLDNPLGGAPKLWSCFCPFWYIFKSFLVQF